MDEYRAVRAAVSEVAVEARESFIDDRIVVSTAVDLAIRELASFPLARHERLDVGVRCLYLQGKASSGQQCACSLSDRPGLLFLQKHACLCGTSGWEVVPGPWRHTWGMARNWLP